MKCPKCGYVSHDYLDACRKCSTDLVTFKQDHSLQGVEPGELDLVEALSGTQESLENSGEFNVEASFFQSQMLVEPEESNADLEAEVDRVLDDDPPGQTTTELKTASDLPRPEPAAADAVFDLSASTGSSLHETAFDRIDLSALEDLDADPAASEGTSSDLDNRIPVFDEESEMILEALDETVIAGEGIPDEPRIDVNPAEFQDSLTEIDFTLDEDAPAPPETVAADAARHEVFDETTLDRSQAGRQDSASKIDLPALPEFEEPPGLETTDAASTAADDAFEATVVELLPTDLQDTVPARELPPPFNLEEPAEPEIAPDNTLERGRLARNDALLTDFDQDDPDLDLPTIELLPCLEEEDTPEPEVTIEADMAGDTDLILDLNDLDPDRLNRSEDGEKT